MSLSLDQLRVIHSAIVGEGDNPPSMVNGANLLLHALGEEARIEREDHALELLRTYVRNLLENEDYLSAATIQWDQKMLDMRPQYGRDIFAFIPKHKKMLFCGAMSVSKTYTSVAWVLLDYLRDPQYTAVKMLAVNENHLKTNMFAHMLALFRACAIPMIDPDELVLREGNNYLGTKLGGNDMGIDGVATKQSRFGPGTIRGYKPKPYRKKPHPKFGNMTRLRICLDEGQQWEEAHFKDLKSPLASATGNEIVKVMISFNPEDPTIEVVKLAEPDHGWVEGDLETLYEWTSKQGWSVLRLDGAKCENVVQRKNVYDGLISWEAYMDNMRGGDNSVSYYVANRGFPPLSNAVNTVIPSSWVNGCWGEATFLDGTRELVAVDLAYAGQDNPVMGVGRWGMASGWRSRAGVYYVFKDRRNPGRDSPRLIAQVDQLIPLTKAADTITVAEEIIHKCKELGVKPESVVVDKSGMGAGTWSHLKAYWGDVLGVTWGEKASGVKFVAEDKEGSDKICDNNVSEMWYCLRKWMDPTVGAILINPNVPQNPLTTQLTQRRYWHLHKGKIRVESKEEYKARNKYSPDEADVLCMFMHLIRVRWHEFPGVTDQPRYNNELGVAVSHEDVDTPDTLEYASGGFAERLD